MTNENDLQYDLELIERTAKEALSGVSETTPALESIRDRAREAQEKLNNSEE